ncbi:ACP synthase [Burkholderia sp. 22PA0099]|uniref:ACP synthase n=1 Tax=Burkholderia sp. 22PA0099 TaxID=3237372 RepID=UPI0039C03CF1
MKRTPTPYRPPTTYRELVQQAHDGLAAKLAQLKRAEKHIRAIEPDLRALHEQNGLFFAAERGSFMLRDRRLTYASRAMYVLSLDSGAISRAYSDRFVHAFLDLGWTFEREGLGGNYGTVILRKPKTQIRVELDASVELRKHLTEKTTDRIGNAKETKTCSAS